MAEKIIDNSNYKSWTLKENKHDGFKREILEFAFKKKHLTYLETKYLFTNNVLENNEYINDNILGKFFRKDLVQPIN